MSSLRKLFHGPQAVVFDDQIRGILLRRGPGDQPTETELLQRRLVDEACVEAVGMVNGKNWEFTIGMPTGEKVTVRCEGFE